MKLPTRSPRRTAAISSLLLTSFGIVGCGKGKNATPPQGPPGIAVTTTGVVTKEVPLYIDEIGKAVASEAVTIQPQVSGKIMSRHFKDGVVVAKGDKLFEIDPRPYEAALAQAKASQAQSEAALVYAKQDFEFVNKLQGTNAVSQETFEQKKNTVAVDEAMVEAGRASVQAAALNVEYCHIVSPITGLAGQRLVDVGNVVIASNQGQGTSLLTIQGLDPIYADFTITEAELARVQQYMAKGTLSVTVQTPADQQMGMVAAPAGAAPPAAAPGEDKPDVGAGVPSTMPTTGTAAVVPFKPRTGKLIFLDNSVQDGSGTVRLRAELPNADRHFWPGQFVNVRLVLAVQKAIMVPGEATQISQQGLFVYKVVANDKSPTKFIAAQQPVTAGQQHGDLVVIDEGLAAGDSVVTTGQMMLQPGAPIMIINAGPPKPPGAGAPPAVSPKTLSSPEAEGQSKTGPQASDSSKGAQK